MVLELLPVDGEASRTRQSEYVDMSLIHLGIKLRDMGIEFEETELATVPTRFAERLLSYLHAFEERESAIRDSMTEHQTQLKQENNRLETLQEATEKMRGEVAILSGKISSALGAYRSEEKLEAQRRRERQRDVCDIMRQNDKKELELRRETMERDRLSKILQKVQK
ncbi:hypothetical protein TraAM80_07638 [Trypanosoma rangeli]|uniref:Uncharacterized protein n=1 Tax=Trypanosoma rangeli TaxID=5698 RepID=A0A3R7NC13_TRYRA|nr:uncharacterized protein TraAM80_07638 [Trypanosoma rangeli]RNF00380.1 hypothetical protein TraAM80_07638 [Trypanosoma rangeli]|eukprot:RNF00380.1 hypothetical protein TraAM80_07638 [Trypanosoma rangeli]